MTWFPRRALASERAQAAWEFLLIFPAFVVVLLALIDFALIGYQYVSLANAAREGARYAATNCGDVGTGCSASDISDWLVSHSGGVLSTPLAAGDSIEVNWIDPGTGSFAHDAGDSVLVRVTHRYGMMVGREWAVISCVEMRLEQAEASATGAADIDDFSAC